MAAIIEQPGLQRNVVIRGTGGSFPKSAMATTVTHIHSRTLCCSHSELLDGIEISATGRSISLTD